MRRHFGQGRVASLLYVRSLAVVLAPAARGSLFALHHGVRGVSGLGAQCAKRPRLEQQIHRMDHRSGLLALQMAAAVSVDEQPQGPALETSETPCAARANALVARRAHARHAPLDRA